VVSYLQVPPIQTVRAVLSYHIRDTCSTHHVRLYYYYYYYLRHIKYVGCTVNMKLRKAEGSQRFKFTPIMTVHNYLCHVSHLIVIQLLDVTVRLLSGII
jgi:hypothetical protein